MPIPGRLIREPLFHFFGIGLLVFLLYPGSGSAPSAPQGQVITVTEVRIARLVAQFEATWQRAPSQTERTALVEDYLREEIYYREALALGLDRDDAMIRRRLRQKMESLGEGAAAIMKPDESELRAHHSAHPEKFALPSRVTFRQVALADASDVASVRSALAEGADPREVGRGGLLPEEMDAAVETAVDGVFGPGFFAQVALLTPGEWQGPVRSGYGAHLVLLTSSDAGTVAPFEAVRDLVIQDWQRQTAETFREAQFAALRSRYEVVLPEAAE